MKYFIICLTLIPFILLVFPLTRKPIIQYVVEHKPKFAYLSFLVTCLSLIIGAMILFIGIYNTFFSDAEVQAQISKYTKGNIILYGGTLTNISDVHAYDLYMKSDDFSPARVIDVQIDTKDELAFKYHSRRMNHAEFRLKRLSKISHCNFDVIIRCKKKEVKDKFHISWGKSGKIEMIASEPDDDSFTNFRRGVRASKISDISHVSRRRWLDSNTRNVK